MELKEAENACAKIITMGERLLEHPSGDAARELEKTCEYYRGQMRGRFGNVGEQLTRTIIAAKNFQKARTNVTDANLELGTALARIRLALRIHHIVAPRGGNDPA